MYIYFSISGLLLAVTGGFLGLLVFLKNKKSKINRTFSLFCFFAVLWSLPYTFWPLSESKEWTLIWFRLLHIGSSFVSIAYLHFVTHWLNKFKKNEIIIKVGYVLATFFSFFVFTPFFIRDMVPKFSMRYWAEPGILYHFYLIMFFGYMIYSSYLLISNYSNQFGLKKVQTKYIILGMLLGYIGGSTNYPLWYGINFPPFGNILSSGFVLLTGYAIIKYRFMDIRVVIRKATIYVFSIIVAGGLGVLIMWLLNQFFGNQVGGFFLFLNILVILAVMAVFIPLISFFEKLANKYFFATLYNEQRKLEEVINELPKTFYLNDTVDLVFKTINETLHVGKIVVLAKEPDEEKFKILKESKKCQKINCGQVINNPLRLLFKKLKKTLIFQEVKSLPIQETEKEMISNYSHKTGIIMALPLMSKGEVFGAILLGEKASGDAYSIQDVHLLENLANQASITIENALLFRKTERFADELQSKVKQATKKLRVANNELKQLDEAKSEFLRIVSHQLRTPMTALRWYSKGLLEGQYGKIKSKKQQETIQDIYNGTVRQIKLIGSFLDVAHIEAGKLTVKKEKGRVEDLIKSVIKELKVFADKSGLYLKFKQPKKPTPEFDFDQEKIREVITNLIDNAIKYTQKGGITVDLSYNNKEEQIEVAVKDTGVGFSGKDKEKLFNKFSRLNTSQIYPWGSGLGLYVCKRLLEAQGGEVKAESPGEGKGSTFSFTLPIHQPESELKSQLSEGSSLKDEKEE